jgi:hypothetical protein
MIEKHPINSERIRRIPQGFGWVDHEVIQNNEFSSKCSVDAKALYFVLITVADQDGLSFYGDALLCSKLGLSKGRLDAARKNLIDIDLVAWDKPLYQVLELPLKKEV